MTGSLPRYESPLDLLLELVRQQKVPVAELPLAPVTAQYLDYMRSAETLDVNLGIEFVHTAAILIQLKSRALLPQDPEVARREPDLRRELIRQLLTYEEARQAAETLGQKRLVEQASFSLPPPRDTEEPWVAGFSLWDLMQEFRALARQDWAPAPVYIPDTGGPTVAELMDWACDRISDPCVLSDLWREQSTTAHQAALFLALLELSRTGAISLTQGTAFGPVQLTRPQ